MGLDDIPPYRARQRGEKEIGQRDAHDDRQEDPAVQRVPEAAAQRVMFLPNAMSIVIVILHGLE